MNVSIQLTFDDLTALRRSSTSASRRGFQFALHEGEDDVYVYGTPDSLRQAAAHLQNLADQLEHELLEDDAWVRLVRPHIDHLPAPEPF